MEYGRTNNKVPHDGFDESRNFNFKLNEVTYYEYQSLYLEFLCLILGILGRIAILFSKIIFFVVLTKWVHEGLSRTELLKEL